MYQTALVTGGAVGLGSAIVCYLHDKGLDIILHYHRSQVEARELSAELSRKRADSVCTLSANLENETEVRQLFQQAQAFKGQVDVLINSAAVFYPTADVADWDKVMGVNLKASWVLADALFAQGLKTGVIVNIADIYGERPLTGHTLYSVSKAGLIMLTQSLAKEYAPSVRVNAVSPGAITWPGGISELERFELLQKIPQARVGQAEDIARAVWFLINEAEYTTGQVLKVDGGRTLSI